MLWLLFTNGCFSNFSDKSKSRSFRFVLQMDVLATLEITNVATLGEIIVLYIFTNIELG